MIAGVVEYRLQIGEAFRLRGVWMSRDKVAEADLNCLVGPFGLPVCLRVIRCCGAHFDA